MHLLRIEHAVGDFDAWKRAFDSDPLHRRAAGVRRYRIFRSVDDPGYVMVDLEFDTLARAEAMQGAVRRLWGEVQGRLMQRGSMRIVEVTEVAEL